MIKIFCFTWATVRYDGSCEQGRTVTTEGILHHNRYWHPNWKIAMSTLTLTMDVYVTSLCRTMQKLKFRKHPQHQIIPVQLQGMLQYLLQFTVGLYTFR
jgi:hypothetical protein